MRERFSTICRLWPEVWVVTTLRSMAHAGSTATPEFTFVNGNCTLDGGAGLLIVTGNLVMNGNPNFNGIILVLGNGYMERDGAGNGNILGTTYIAKFARSWPASENAMPHPFLAPTFITNGDG